jgi:hypothetical protein
MLALRVDETDEQAASKSLRDYIGRDVRFVTTGSEGERLSLLINIPHDVAVPKVSQSEEVTVTFVCTRGMLRQGNTAKIIERRSARARVPPS